MILRTILLMTTFVGVTVLGLMLTSKVTESLQDIDHLAELSPDRVVGDDADRERTMPAIKAEPALIQYPETGNPRITCVGLIFELSRELGRTGPSPSESGPSSCPLQSTAKQE